MSKCRNPLLCLCPHRAEALSDDARLTFDVRRLSVAHIGPKSKTERPRKTKIGTEVAHVAHDSDTTLKVKRSRSPDRFTHRGVYTSGSCSGERGKVFTVGTYCYVAVCRRGGRLGGEWRFGAQRVRKGAGHIVAAARLQLVL